MDISQRCAFAEGVQQYPELEHLTYEERLRELKHGGEKARSEFLPMCTDIWLEYIQKMELFSVVSRDRTIN